MIKFLAVFIFVFVVGILLFIALWALESSFIDLYKEEYDIDKNKTKKGNHYE